MCRAGRAAKTEAVTAAVGRQGEEGDVNADRDALPADQTFRRHEAALARRYRLVPAPAPDPRPSLMRSLGDRLGAIMDAVRQRPDAA